MGYYDMNKEERQKFIHKMGDELTSELKSGKTNIIIKYSSDDDVYIRKNVSTILGRMYRDQGIFKEEIIQVMGELLKNDNEKVRQTAVYLAGKIGKKDAWCFAVSDHANTFVLSYKPESMEWMLDEVQGI